MNYEKYGLRDANEAKAKRVNSVIFLITLQHEMVVIELNHREDSIPEELLKDSYFTAVLDANDDCFEDARLIRECQPNGKVFSSKQVTMQAIYDFGKHLELVQP